MKASLIFWCQDQDHQENNPGGNWGAGQGEEENRSEEQEKKNNKEEEKKKEVKNKEEEEQGGGDEQGGGGTKGARVGAVQGWEGGEGGPLTLYVVSSSLKSLVTLRDSWSNILSVKTIEPKTLSNQKSNIMHFLWWWELQRSPY